MNLLLLDPGELEPGPIARLRDRRSQHVRDVLGLGQGDALRVGIMGRGLCTARLADWQEETLVLQLDEAIEVVPRPCVELLVALPRPKALRKLLQTVASMAVRRIILVNAWRVNKSYWHSPVLEPEALRSELVLGCEQGRQVWIPEVVFERLFVPCVEALGQSTKHTRLLLHPYAGEAIETAHAPGSRHLLAIGPEGGWIEAELESFRRAGFRAVSISRSILRSEIAAAAALAQLELLDRQAS